MSSWNARTDIRASCGLTTWSSVNTADYGPGLLYRALLENQVDIVAGNSTDGLIAARDLAILEDDKHYFPPYQAVPMIRRETLKLHPAVRDALDELGGKISDEEMRRLNYAVDGEHRDVAEVVREFLRGKHLD